METPEQAKDRMEETKESLPGGLEPNYTKCPKCNLVKPTTGFVKTDKDKICGDCVKPKLEAYDTPATLTLRFARPIYEAFCKLLYSTLDEWIFTANPDRSITADVVDPSHVSMVHMDIAPDNPLVHILPKDFKPGYFPFDPDMLKCKYLFGPHLDLIYTLRDPQEKDCKHNIEYISDDIHGQIPSPRICQQKPRVPSLKMGTPFDLPSPQTFNFLCHAKERDIEWLKIKASDKSGRLHYDSKEMFGSESRFKPTNPVIWTDFDISTPSELRCDNIYSLKYVLDFMTTFRNLIAGKKKKIDLPPMQFTTGGMDYPGRFTLQHNGIKVVMLLAPRIEGS